MTAIFMPESAKRAHIVGLGGCASGGAPPWAFARRAASFFSCFSARRSLTACSRRIFAIVCWRLFALIELTSSVDAPRHPRTSPLADHVGLRYKSGGLLGREQARGRPHTLAAPSGVPPVRWSISRDTPSARALPGRVGLPRVSPEPRRCRRGSCAHPRRRHAARRRLRGACVLVTTREGGVGRARSCHRPMPPPPA